MQQELVARNWRELIRPRRLELEEAESSERYGRFSCEPLERGFGQTLGNALRRVLLSSLQGAAITTVRIDGVLHEFSTIPGVLEDVSDIILNLKETRLRMHAEGPKTIRLTRKDKGEVVAGDLQSDDQTVEVMNPDHKICDAHGSGGRLRASSATVELRQGLRPRREATRPRRCRSERSPSIRPSHRCSTGQLLRDPGSRRARDRLRPPESRGLDRRHRARRLTPWRIAAKILKEQLTIFINFDEPDEVMLPSGWTSRTPLNPNLFKLGRRARAVGSVGELPAEREHPLHRRARPANREARCSRRRTSVGSP